MGTQEFGEYLRTRREAQGLTIADVSDRTKIHMRYIRALEEGRLEALPGLVYAKAFVRHYARAVGEDPEALAAQFQQAIQLEGEAAALTTGYRRKPRRKARRESRIPWPWVIVVAALAVLGALIANVVDFGGEIALPSQPAPAATSAVELPAGLVSEPARQEEAEAVPAMATGEPAPVAGAPDLAGPGVVAPSPQPGPAAGEGGGPEDEAPGAPPAPGGALGGGPEGEGEPPQGAEVEAVPGVVLEVVVERASWFRVEADGALIFTGVLDDGESAVWAADEELLVRYGRPEGVFITWNGQYLGRAGTGVINVRYTRETVERI